MDRFIDVVQQLTQQFKKTLKSNMDRFIGTSFVNNSKNELTFKIQYGQIYSEIY